LIKDNTLIYLTTVYDHTIQVIDTIEAFRDIVSGMLDIYLSVKQQAKPNNESPDYYRHNIYALTFIAGIYGMNFNTSASP